MFPELQIEVKLIIVHIIYNLILIEFIQNKLMM